MSKKKFAEELHEVIRNSGIRQNIIAQAMGLSSAAISQFIHGTALPSLSQLGTITAMLNIDQKTHNMLLQLLEEEKNNFPESLEDNEILTSIEKKDDINFEKLFLDNPNFVFGDSSNGIPVIHLLDLFDYDPSVNINDFACLHLHDTIVRDYGEDIHPVMVKASGDQLGICYAGMLQIMLKDTQDDDAVLELSRFPKSGFRLSPRKPENLKGLEVFFATDYPSDETPMWSIPLVELIVIPFSRNND